MRLLATVLDLLGKCLVVLATSLLLAGGIVVIVLHATSEHLLAVQTGSMIPTFKPGDAVIVQSVNPKSLQPGDIISYKSPANPTLTITHRLIGLNKQTGWLTTRGDASRTTDPVFAPQQVLGRVTAITPKLGLVLDALRRPLGLLLAVYLPALVVIVYEARRLTRQYSPGVYRPFG